LPEPTALDSLKKNLQQTFIEMSAAKAGTAKPMKFTNVLTGAEVHPEDVNGVMRLSAGDSLNTLPAIWLIGDRQ
jgi:cysteine sulfinate desulfinase/cysteine desulfurase-like protein